jgi:hypothetical protein
MSIDLHTFSIDYHLKENKKTSPDGVYFCANYDIEKYGREVPK